MMQSPHDALEARLSEAALSLLKIPSVTGAEDAVVDALEAWAYALPQLTRDDVTRVGNALVVGQPDGERPCVALVGHVDTVPAHIGNDEPAVTGDIIRGRGASKMKGAIAVMQVLFERLELARLPFSLIAVLYDRGEAPAAENGLQPLLETQEMLRQIDLAITMSPTNNALQLGCMGVVEGRVSFRGRAAPAEFAWEGENAVHKAGPFLSMLKNRAPVDVNVDGLVFRETLSANLASGGKKRSLVPDRFDLSVSYRFAPVRPLQQTMNRAVMELRQVAEGADIEILDVAPPGPVALDNPLVDHLQSQGQLDVEPKQAWTDVARFATHGVDAVNFGPGLSSQAHKAGEWVSLASLVRGYDVLQRALCAPLAGL